MIIVVSARFVGIDLGHFPWFYLTASLVTSVTLAVAAHHMIERPLTVALRRWAVFARSPRPRGTRFAKDADQNKPPVI